MRIFLTAMSLILFFSGYAQNNRGSMYLQSSVLVKHLHHAFTYEAFNLKNTNPVVASVSAGYRMPSGWSFETGMRYSTYRFNPISKLELASHGYCGTGRVFLNDAAAKKLQNQRIVQFPLQIGNFIRMGSDWTLGIKSGASFFATSGHLNIEEYNTPYFEKRKISLFSYLASIEVTHRIHKKVLVGILGEYEKTFTSNSYISLSGINVGLRIRYQFKDIVVNNKIGKRLKQIFKWRG